MAAKRVPENRQFLARLMVILSDQIVLVMSVFYLAGVGFFLTYLGSLQQQLYQASALENAQLYSEAITEFRTLYTREVVSRARDFGLEVTHDYRAKEHAIPLPATLSMLLGKSIGAAESGAETFLYSAYPFPWRRDEHRAHFDPMSDGRPSFAQRAWQHWQDHPEDKGAYFEFAGTKLFYATADRMREACVNCHNSHPSTPKNDWKEGDVRGILQVTNPTAALSQQSEEDLVGVYMFASAFALVGGGFIFVVILGTRRSAAELRDRVRELAERGEELEFARQAADVAAEAKSQFMANISHEIRTPMNAVLGLTELLLGSELNPDQKGQLETVHGSAAALLGIVDGVLDFSKLEAARVRLENRPFDLLTTLESVVDLMAPAARAKKIDLSLRYGDDLERRFTGDAGKVRQVTINLVGNALKFTSEGRVEILVEEEPGISTATGLRIRVVDTGIGIPEASQKAIFDWFSQGDTSTTRTYGGTGLGLSISQQLVTLLGGEIGFKSSVGSGSEFWFTLPLKVQAEPLEGHGTESSSAGGQDLDLRAGHVMLAEDNRINQKVATLMLAKLGQRVSLANDGKEAVKLWRADPGDLILMDCQMPVMDGFDATREIRRLEEAEGLARTPIIAMTAGVTETERSSCFEAGMDDFIAKPITMEALGAVLAKYSNRSETQAES